MSRVRLCLPEERNWGKGHGGLELEGQGQVGCAWVGGSGSGDGDGIQRAEALRGKEKRERPTLGGMFGSYKDELVARSSH